MDLVGLDLLTGRFWRHVRRLLNINREALVPLLEHLFDRLYFVLHIAYLMRVRFKITIDILVAFKI